MVENIKELPSRGKWGFYTGVQDVTAGGVIYLPRACILVGSLPPTYSSGRLQNLQSFVMSPYVQVGTTFEPNIDSTNDQFGFLIPDTLYDLLWSLGPSAKWDRGFTVYSTYIFAFKIED